LNTYYFGTPGGGIWKSTNAGQTWTPIFDRPAWPPSARSPSPRRTPQTIYVAPVKKPAATV